jgi:hypothetical protein
MRKGLGSGHRVIPRSFDLKSMRVERVVSILDGIVKRIGRGLPDFHIDGMIQGERVAGCEGRRIVGFAA